MKSDKITGIIYADIKSLIKKTDGCANYPEKYSATTLEGHIPCEYSISTIWAFDYKRNFISQKGFYEKVL